MTACPLCGCTATSSIFRKRNQAFRRCDDCGLRFSAASQNANFANAFDDFEPAYLQYLGPSPDDEANHAALVKWIEGFVKLDETTSLLDVGAGSGKFLDYIRRVRPCRTAGIEPSAALHRAYQLDRRGIENVALPEFLASGIAPFRCVTVLDVLEHVDQPMSFARALARVAAPGAFVFLSTPDAGSALAKVLGRFWHHYNPYHLSLFDPTTIARLAEAAGFQTVAFARRPRYMSASYVRAYIRDFLLGSPRSSRSRGPGWTVPVNLLDVMSVVWRKPERSSNFQAPHGS